MVWRLVQSQGHSGQGGAEVAEEDMHAMNPLELSYMEELRKFIRSKGTPLL